jgi:hypothetical protein
VYGDGLPTTSRRSPELKKVAAVVFGTLCGRGSRKREEWEGLEPEELAVTISGRGKGGDAGICHGDGELSLGGSSGRREERRGKRAGGQKRGARAALGLGIDAWRWSMAGGGEDRPGTGGSGAAEEQRQSRACARGGRRGEEVRGTLLEIAKPQGLHSK